MTDGGSRQATGLDDWLQRRFPGGGTLEERLRVRNTRRLPGLVAVLGGVYLASAAVTTRWHPAAGRPALPLVVVSVALSVAAVVAAAVCLVQIVRAQGREGPRDARLLPALSWAERGELLTELRGRRSVPPGDEEALAVLLRSRRNTVPFAWLGLAQLTGAVAQSMRSPGGYLGAVGLGNAAVGALLVALAVRARLDVRAAERAGREAGA